MTNPFIDWLTAADISRCFGIPADEVRRWIDYVQSFPRSHRDEHGRQVWPRHTIDEWLESEAG